MPRRDTKEESCSDEIQNFLLPKISHQALDGLFNLKGTKERGEKKENLWIKSKFDHQGT